jgi:hypothetical protein
MLKRCDKELVDGGRVKALHSRPDAGATCRLLLCSQGFKCGLPPPAAAAASLPLRLLPSPRCFR